MAIILKSGTPRVQDVNTTYLRSSTIEIAKTGLINSVTSSGKAVKVLSLGYRGEHHVTRL